MRSKNLLVISNDFPDSENKYIKGIFVKEQLKYLKNYFDKIYVICPVALGMDYVRKVQHTNYVFDNVHVYFPNYFNIPFFYFYSRDFWISMEYSATVDFIKKTGIDFDLIHAHFTWPSGALAARLKREFNVPLIITEHTSETFLKVIKKKDSQYIKTWEISDAIIRVRNGDISLFHDVGIQLDKVHHIPNGYDFNKFFQRNMLACRKELGLPADVKIILNIGNLYSSVKGHEYLIRAMSEVINERQDSLCIIVGEGKLRENLENLVNELELKDHVKLVGGKSHDEIPLWINACDLFVLPSLNEGNPTVMFECLGCGKPFIGTSVGGMPEIIVSEDYGLLCEPAKPEELAKNILLGLKRNWDTDVICKYSSQFSWSTISEKIYGVYSQVKNSSYTY